MTGPATLTIDIWSDVMCPWCAVGYAQLRKGLEQLEGEIAAEIRWRPFELNPDMAAEGEPQAQHLARKTGRSEQEIAAGRMQLHNIGDRAGFSFAYSGAGEPPKAMVWNTHGAHKLLKWALDSAGPAVQTQLKTALFAAHFQQRRDVSDPEVLAAIAESVGLDREAALAALADPELGEQVRTEEGAAFDMNITGVPAMLINGKYMIPGAQEPEVYANALRRAVAKGG